MKNLVIIYIFKANLLFFTAEGKSNFMKTYKRKYKILKDFNFLFKYSYIPLKIQI